jgi:flagellar FliJ protein
VSRAFSLAGLLRLRHLQQDQAAGDLAEANATSRAMAARVEAARGALDNLPTDPAGADTFHAIVAARASSRSMLAELSGLATVTDRAAANAQLDYDARKAASVSLEKLELRHDAAEAEADLQSEQAVIDEIASTGWHRRSTGREL